MRDESPACLQVRLPGRILFLLRKTPGSASLAAIEQKLAPEFSSCDLYEFSKLLGHPSIKMTERYAKLAQKRIMKSGNMSREIWSKLEPQKEAGEEVQETKDGHFSGPGFSGPG